jgi:hypothetical protein
VDPPSRLARTSQVTSGLRTRLAERLQNAALESFVNSARVHLGLAPESSTATVPSPEQVTPAQLRPVGRTHLFEGTLPASADTPVLSWSRTPATASRTAALFSCSAAFLLVLAASAIIWQRRRRFARIRWFAGGTLIVLLASIAIGFGASGFAAGLGLAFLGWVGRSRSAIAS